MPQPPAQDWERVDAYLMAGAPSFTVWLRLGKRRGLSLEAVVMRRRALLRV